MTFAIEMQGITKRCGPLVANHDVALQVRKGEIHALVGENGAGKTTLMNVLFGLYQPDEGTLAINGRTVEMESPRTAISLGLGMVHQHFKLVPSLTVADNIFLGMEITRNGLIDRKAQSAKVRELSDRFGLKVDPDDIAADPRNEAARLALDDPGCVMRLVETVDAPVRQRHAVDPPAEDIDPEQRIVPRRPHRAFAQPVAPVARDHPHIGHQWLSRGKPRVCAIR